MVPSRQDISLDVTSLFEENPPTNLMAVLGCHMAAPSNSYPLIMFQCRYRAVSCIMTTFWVSAANEMGVDSDYLLRAERILRLENW